MTPIHLDTAVGIRCRLRLPTGERHFIERLEMLNHGRGVPACAYIKAKDGSLLAVDLMHKGPVLERYAGTIEHVTESIPVYEGDLLLAPVVMSGPVRIGFGRFMVNTFLDIEVTGFYIQPVLQDGANHPSGIKLPLTTHILNHKHTKPYHP